MSFRDYLTHAYWLWLDFHETQCRSLQSTFEDMLARWQPRWKAICACETDELLRCELLNAGISLRPGFFDQPTTYRTMLQMEPLRSLPFGEAEEKWERVRQLICDIVTDDHAYWRFLINIQPGEDDYSSQEFIRDKVDPIYALKQEEELKYCSIEVESFEQRAHWGPRDSVEPWYSDDVRTTEELHHGRLRLTDEAKVQIWQRDGTDEVVTQATHLLAVRSTSPRPRIKMEEAEPYMLRHVCFSLSPSCVQ